MFNRRKRLDMLQNIQVTSKASLKMQCLYIAKGNIKDAQELYDFFAKDMPELPDFEPTKPTFLENTKETVNGLMSWLKENQQTLTQGYDFIRGIIQKNPPIPKEPLPPIN